MFSIITMASSTTNPVEMVSAISDRLSRLVAQHVHDGKCADQRKRHRHAGNDGGARGCAGKERSPAPPAPMVSISSNSTSLTDAWMLVVRSVSVVTFIDAGRLASSCGSSLLDAVDHADGVGARLPLNVHDHRGRLVHPRRLLGVFHPVDHLGNVFQKDGRAVAIRDDDVLVFGRWL